MLFHRGTILPITLGAAFLISATMGGDWSPWVEGVVGILAFLLIVFSRHVTLLAGGFRSPTVWLLLTLAVAAVVSAWSQSSYASLRTWTYVWIGAATFIAAREVAREHIRMLLSWLHVVSASAATWALVDQLQRGLDRTEGFLGNANALGAYLALLLPVGVYVALGATRWRRWLAWVGVGVVALALVRTFSYTSWFGLALATVIIIATVGRRAITWRRVGAVIVIGLVLLGGAVALRSAQLGSVREGVRLDRVVDAEHFRLSFTQRWRFIISAANMIADYPLTGIGLGAYQVSYPQYALTRFEQPRYAHNAYLELAAEAGVGTALLFLGALLAVLLHVTRQYRSDPEGQRRTLWLSVVVAGSAVAAAVDFGWHFPAVWLSFWALAGILVGPAPHHPSRGSRVVGVLVLLVSLGVVVRGLGVAYAWTDFERGTRAGERGEAELAVQYYERGLRVDPDPTRRNRLAEVLWLAAFGDAELLAKADAQLQRSLQWAPTDYFTHRLVARIAYSQRDTQRADAAFQTALRYDNFFHLDITIEYVNFLIQQERLEDAALLIERALAAHPEGSWSVNPNLARELEIVTALQRAVAEKQAHAQ